MNKSWFEFSSQQALVTHLSLLRLHCAEPLLGFTVSELQGGGAPDPTAFLPLHNRQPSGFPDSMEDAGAAAKGSLGSSVSLFSSVAKPPPESTDSALSNLVAQVQATFTAHLL